MCAKEMKTREEIKAHLKELKADDRYKSGLKKPATVIENAPLALIQLSIEAKIAALEWVLGEY